VPVILFIFSKFHSTDMINPKMKLHKADVTNCPASAMKCTQPIQLHLCSVWSSPCLSWLRQLKSAAFCNGSWMIRKSKGWNWLGETQL
jgi:hypothetical protein